jgi:hypothetical protein
MLHTPTPPVLQQFIITQPMLGDASTSTHVIVCFVIDRDSGFMVVLRHCHAGGTPEEGCSFAAAAAAAV